MKIVSTLLLFCSLPLFSQSPSSPGTLLQHAETLYWFGMSESGDMNSFREGLRLVKDAENQLKNEEVENRAQLLLRAEGLRSDLQEQSIIAGDTLNGSMPLQRILLFQAPQLEIFDEPDVLATVRATEGLLSTVQSHWANIPQLDVVYNSSVIHLEDGSPIRPDRTPSRSAAMENEASYLFNRHPRFFNHNAKQIFETLTTEQVNEFYSKGLSADTADILTEAFKITRLLEVSIRELDLHQNIRFFLAQARLFRQSEGLQDDRIFVYGFTRDARETLPWILLALFIIWSTCISYTLFFYRKENRSSQKKVILLSSAGFLVGICITILLQYFLQRLYPGPEALLKTSLWFLILQLISLVVLPSLIAGILRIQILKYCDWDLYTTLHRPLYLMSVTLGVLPVIAYACLTYLGPQHGLLLLGCVAPAMLIAWSSLFSETPDPFLSKVTGIAFAAFATAAYLRIPEMYIDGHLQITLALLTMVGLGLLVIPGKNLSGILSQPLLSITLLLLSGCAWMAVSPILALSISIPALLLPMYHICKTRKKEIHPPSKTDTTEAKTASLELFHSCPNEIPYFKTEKLKEWLSEEKKFGTEGKFSHFQCPQGGGKTRFIQNLEGELNKDFLILHGQGNPQEPLGAVKSAFRSCGFQLLSNQQLAADVMERTGAHLLSVLPLAGALLSLVDTSDTDTQTKTKDTLHIDLCNFLRNLQKKTNKPVILIFDDADKLDTASLAWLAYMQKDLRSRPYPLHLILLSTKNTCIIEGIDPEQSPFDFSPEDLGTFLTQNLGIEKELGDALHAELKASPEFCTPFYCIEWLDSLYNKKWIAQDGGAIFRCPEKNNQPLQKPESLTQAVRLRIEQLSSQTRAVLLAAAVDGEHFDKEILTQVLGQGFLDIESALDNAEKDGIVCDVLSEDGRFAFVSPLYHNQILESTGNPLSNRNVNKPQKILDLHKRYSDAYSGASRTQIDSNHCIFKSATHALQAGTKYIPRALKRSQTAADICLNMGDYHSARQWARQALDHAGGQIPPETHADLLLRILEAEAVLHPEINACASALRLLNTTQLPPEKKANLQLACAEILQRSKEQADIQQAQSLIEDYLDSYTDDMSAKWIQAQGLRLTIMRKNNKSSSDQLSQAYTETLRKIPDPKNADRAIQEMIARVYNDYGEYLSTDKQPQAAIDWFEKSLSLKTEIGDRAGMAISYGGLGRCILYSWNYAWPFFAQNIDRAHECFEQDEKLSIKLGDLRGQVMMPSLLGHLALLQNQAVEAVAEYQRALTLALAQNDTYSQAFALQGLLLAHKLNENPTAVQKIRKQLHQLDSTIKKKRKSDLLKELAPNLALNEDDLWEQNC